MCTICFRNYLCTSDSCRVLRRGCGFDKRVEMIVNGKIRLHDKPDLGKEAVVLI